jgi:16S rRNA C967 or C1407 C5-methylase (RsmB/RsmF family)
MNLPKQLISRIETIYGNNANKILDGFNIERIGSLRINTLQFPELKKHEIPSIIANEFSEKNILLTPFEDIPHVFTFDKKNEYAIKGTQAFYNGLIYLQ